MCTYEVRREVIRWWLSHHGKGGKLVGTVKAVFWSGVREEVKLLRSAPKWWSYRDDTSVAMVRAWELRESDGGELWYDFWG